MTSGKLRCFNSLSLGDLEEREPIITDEGRAARANKEPASSLCFQGGYVASSTICGEEACRIVLRHRLLLVQIPQGSMTIYVRKLVKM